MSGRMAVLAQITGSAMDAAVAELGTSGTAPVKHSTCGTRPEIDDRLPRRHRE